MNKVYGLGSIALLFVGLVSCGGGGGGAAPLSPPAFNMDGTWSFHETIVSNNAGIVNGTVLNYSIVMNHAAGSNTVTVRDTRSAIGDTGAATLSGTTFTYSGERYPEFGCANMVGTYNGTVTGASGVGTALSGTGTVTCLDDGKGGTTSITATKP